MIYDNSPCQITPYCALLNASSGQGSIKFLTFTGGGSEDNYVQKRFRIIGISVGKKN